MSLGDRLQLGHIKTNVMNCQVAVLSLRDPKHLTIKESVLIVPH